MLDLKFFVHFVAGIMLQANTILFMLFSFHYFHVGRVTQSNCCVNQPRWTFLHFQVLKQPQISEGINEIADETHEKESKILNLPCNVYLDWLNLQLLYRTQRTQ